MAVSKEEILEAISNMSVIDVVDLVKKMEEKFGVSAATPVAAVPGAVPETAAPPAEEKSEFNVIMTSFGDKKIEVIKVIRTITGLALKEAKDMVEGVPSTVKEAVTKEDAESIKKRLEEVGASVEVK
ncbi:MAG: 50S ribosomal protein L7/L12 [Coxiella sp. DG_40]|nr:MAG: 50S ribosomal protein L7/L12 [Coxiella sp. DG_40]